jgi:hypothetical protein
MTENTFRPVLTTQADLADAWRHLMQPLGFSRASLWLMLIDGDDRPIPALTEIADCPDPLDDDEADSLAEMLAHVLGQEIERSDGRSRWALLRSRPGRHGADDVDRGWAAAVTAACRRRGVPLDVFHLATDDDVVPIPLDDLSGYLQAS